MGLMEKTTRKPKIKAKDSLSIPQAPITRSRSKKPQEALIGYIQDWGNQGSLIAHARFSTSEDFNEWVLNIFCKFTYMKTSMG